MGLFLGDSEPSKIFLGDTPISKVFLGDTQIRPTGPDKDYLCFTAEQASSKVRLVKTGTPTSVTLETSTDGTNWTTYTIGDTITLSSVGDKVYFRNTSTEDTRFSTGTNNRYQFDMSGSISCSGDINFLLNKNSTDTVSSYCYKYLFMGCTSITTPPKLPATTLNSECYRAMFNGCTNLTTTPVLPATTIATSCYRDMFNGCTSLVTLPELPARTLVAYCCNGMFNGCSGIKISQTKTGDYQTEYMIPSSGNGTTASSWNTNMFANTGGTFTGTPSINTKYYTSNTVISNA